MSDINPKIYFDNLSKVKASCDEDQLLSGINFVKNDFTWDMTPICSNPDEIFSIATTSVTSKESQQPQGELDIRNWWKVINPLDCKKTEGGGLINSFSLSNNDTMQLEGSCGEVNINQNSCEPITAPFQKDGSFNLNCDPSSYKKSFISQLEFTNQGVNAECCQIRPTTNDIDSADPDAACKYLELQKTTLAKLQTLKKDKMSKNVMYSLIGQGVLALVLLAISSF